jgi:PKD repeat protein
LICPSCGKRNPIGAAACSRCGRWLATSRTVGVSYPRRTELARGGPGAFAIAAALVAGFLFVGGALYVTLSGNGPFAQPSSIALGPTDRPSLPIFVQPTPTASPSPSPTPTPTFDSLATPTPSFLFSPSPSIFPTDTPFSTSTPIPGQPKADFRGTIQADGLTVNWRDLSTGNVNGWTWNFGDGSAASNAQNPSHTYPHLGDYNVTLTVTGSSGSDARSKVLHLRPPATPTPTPTPPPSPPHADFGWAQQGGTLKVVFHDKSAGTVTHWSWDFGDTGTSTKQSPSHTYVCAAGSTCPFSVSLTASNDIGQSDHKTIPISVVGPTPTPPPPPPPSADFTWAQQSGLTVQFTDASTNSPNQWSWDFGDPTSGQNSSTGQNPSHDYTLAGTYDVKLTVSNAGGSNSKTITITVV